MDEKQAYQALHAKHGGDHDNGTVRIMVCGHCHRVMCELDADRPYCPMCNPIFGVKSCIDYLHPEDAEALKMFVKPLHRDQETAYGAYVRLGYRIEYTNSMSRYIDRKPVYPVTRLFSVVAPARQQAEANLLSYVRRWLEYTISSRLNLWKSLRGGS